MNPHHALILVDLQNDFLPGGALAVPGGDDILPLIQELMPRFATVVATMDWHPPEHSSFAANHPDRNLYDRIELQGLPQTLWPVHCVQGTPGAELSSRIDGTRITRIFHKGTLPDVDSYSGFHDNGHRHSTGLAEWLRGKGITDLLIAGLATDYCVKSTVLDALAEGFRVTLHLPACRGVNLSPGDVEAAVTEMEQAGASISM